MKTLFRFFALCAAVTALASCQKLFNSSSASDKGDTCMLTVSFDEASTRVLGQTEAKEKTIKDVQIFVFNRSTGKLDASLHESGLSASGSHTISAPLSCTRGEREVWAIVNAPVNHVDGAESDRISTLDQLKSTSTALTDNSSDALVMVGSSVKTLAGDTENVSVSVHRKCAAVVIKSIKNEMGVPAYQVDGKLKITGAYLLNVPNVQRYDLSIESGTLTAASNWISPNVKSSDASQLKLTADSYAAADQLLKYGATFGKSSTFYAYPNSATADPASTWSPSRTVLVVEALVDGQACIYPVTLGSLQSNYKYEVNLSIRHIGGDPADPWKKIEFSNLGASITVTDWSTGASVTETI